MLLHRASESIELGIDRGTREVGDVDHTGTDTSGCTYSCTYDHIRALKGLISGLEVQL